MALCIDEFLIRAVDYKYKKTNIEVHYLKIFIFQGSNLGLKVRVIKIIIQ